MSQPSEVRLVIYKEIVKGDLSKFSATSNITPSGGGARDLRFSPADKFFPAFQRMFLPKGGILSGRFLWPDHTETGVEIHPPTNSRPNEVRINRIHACFPDHMIPDDFTDCILLLVLDGSGGVFPYFTSRASLRRDGWHPAVRDAVLRGLGAVRHSKTTAMGYVDIENGGSYTNGRI